jgi:hypothetical protein
LFATSWTDVDVSCEVCHGPGSRHIAWANSAEAKTAAPDPTMGLTNPLKPTDHGHWEMNPQTGIARRTEKLVSRIDDGEKSSLVGRSVNQLTV